MNILFLTISIPDNLSYSGLYIDLAQELARKGHNVTVMGSTQNQSSISKELNLEIVRVQAPKIVGEKNRIKKGIAMATFPFYFSYCYNKFLKNRTFDWIVLPTPPITLIDFACKIKKRNKARLYLILRDIHPQAPWSLHEIPFKWMYNYLYRKSQKAYMESDIIGTMSQGNSDYVMQEHPNIDRSKFAILLNWLKNDADTPLDSNIEDVRKKYGLENKFIVLFGGNISLGQRVENIADLINHFKDDPRITFVIIGKGIQKQKLIDMTKGLNNVLFFDFMPRKDYMTFSRSANLGLISINENNSAPTCPSKAVAYMSMRIPILAMINKGNDYGLTYIEKPQCGYWAIGSDKEDIYKKLQKLVGDPELCHQMGTNGYRFFLNYLTVEKAAEEIENQISHISK